MQSSGTQGNPINGTVIFIRQRNPSGCPNSRHLTKLSLAPRAARSSSCTEQTHVRTLVGETQGTTMTTSLPVQPLRGVRSDHLCTSAVLRAVQDFPQKNPQRDGTSPAADGSPASLELPTPSFHHYKGHQACFSSKMLVGGNKHLENVSAA